MKNSYNYVRNNAIEIINKHNNKHNNIKNKDIEEYILMRNQFNPSKSPPNNSFIDKIEQRLKLYYDKSYN